MPDKRRKSVAEFIEPFRVEPGSTVSLVTLADLGCNRAFRHDRQRLLKALQIVDADEHRRWLAVAGDDHAVLLARVQVISAGTPTRWPDNG